MAPLNIFSLIQSRRYGGPRPRLGEAQLRLLRLRPRWELPRLLRGSQAVREVLPLGLDAFCLLYRAGGADVFAMVPQGVAIAGGAATGGGRLQPWELQWLLQLSLFEGEKVRLVARLPAAGVLLTAFSPPDSRRVLHLRGLDTAAVLAGQARTRRCGLLSDAHVHPGGFVSVCDRCQRVWLSENGTTLQAFDDCTFEQLFLLGPWGLEAPVMTFRFHSAMPLAATSSSPNLEVWLYCSRGHLLSRRALALERADAAALVAGEPVQAAEAMIDLLEFYSGHLLLKRHGCNVQVVDLLGSGGSCELEGTKDFAVEATHFLQAQSILLLVGQSSVLLWRLLTSIRCASSGTGCDQKLPPPVGPLRCARLGKVPFWHQPELRRMGLEEQICAALLPQPPQPPSWASASQGLADLGAWLEGATMPRGEDLDLLDLLRGGGKRLALHGACSGTGGGGVAHLHLDLKQGLLLLMGRRGGLFAYSLASAGWPL